VRQFGQRIDLVHELAQLAERPKKSRMTAESAFGLMSFCGRHRVDALIEHRHALLDETLRAGEADAALVGEQFAHRADAAAAQGDRCRPATPSPFLSGADTSWPPTTSGRLGQDALIQGLVESRASG
jgi:hypothetical protein